MGGKESDVILNFKTNGEVTYAKTVKDINKEMNLAATEYRNQVSAMDKDATATEKLTAVKQKLEKQIELAGKRTELLREEYAKSVQETGEFSKESQNLYKKLLDAQTGENKLKDALESTNDALKAQGDVSISTAEKLKKIEEAGEKIKGVGTKMSVGLTAPLVGIAATGIKTANDLSTAQTQIQASFGMTESEAKNLNQTMEDVFASGMVESIDDAKESVIQLINQMPNLKNESSSALQDIILQAKSLEQTFGSDYEETLKGANALMVAYGMSGQEAMDLITVGTQNGLDKTHELGDNLSEYATLFKDAGWSAEDMFQILQGGLESGGYNLDRINDLIKEFSIRVSDGTIEKAMEGLSQTSKDAFQSFKDGNMTQAELFQNLVGEISEATSETDKLALASSIFGTQGEDAGAGVLEAMSMVALSGDGVTNMYSDVSGAAKKFSDEMQETVSYQSAMNELMLAGADIGEVFAPYILKAAEAIKGFAQWFQGLDQGTKNLIVTIGTIVAVIGPVLVVLGSLMGSITKIVSGVRNFITIWGKLAGLFGMSGGWFALAVLAIGALIGGLIWAYNNVQWFHDGVNAFFQGVSDVAVQVFNYMAGYLGSVFGGILANFENFAAAGSRILDGIVNFVTGVFTGNWKQAWQGLSDIVGGVFDGMVAVIKAPLNLIIGLINGVIGGLNNIKVPKWVPKIGGKGINISEIPYLAKGGSLLSGQAIVGEAGPELLTAKNGKTTVTPLSESEKREGISGKYKGNVTVEQHNHFGNVDANNPSELARMNRKLYQAGRFAMSQTGGVPG